MLEKVMLERRSVRKYNDSEISDEEIKKILEAGLLAPSSRNRKPVELILVKDKNTIDALSKAKVSGIAFTKEAFADILVVGDKDKSDLWEVDCSIVMSFMMLRAQELGIGNCWVNLLNRSAGDISSERYVKDLLYIPEAYGVLSMLAIGRSDEMGKTRAKDQLEWDRVHNALFNT